MDSLQQIKEIASQWVARRHGAGWTPADEAALQEWLNASMSNRVEYLGHENTWRDCNKLKVLGAGAKPGMVPTLDDWRASPYFKHLQRSQASTPRPVTGEGGTVERGVREKEPVTGLDASPQDRDRECGQGRGMRARVFALAASVLVVCAASYLGWEQWRSPRYSTAIGVITAVPLPDGSKITLNTDSEIRLAVTEQTRTVALEQGEAYFDVAPDPSRPFVVMAGKRRVVVLGTKFSVRRNGNDIRVIVTEGKVRLDAPRPATGEGGTTEWGVREKGPVTGRPQTRKAPARDAEAEGYLLTAGAIADIVNDKVTVEQRPLPKAEELLSWRDGYLMFDEVTLAEAVAEFNRYNTHKFVIEDPAIASLPVAGHFRSTSVEPFARLLEQGFPVTVSRKSDKIALGAR